MRKHSFGVLSLDTGCSPLQAGTVGETSYIAPPKLDTSYKFLKHGFLLRLRGAASQLLELGYGNLEYGFHESPTTILEIPPVHFVGHPAVLNIHSWSSKTPQPTYRGLIARRHDYWPLIPRPGEPAALAGGGVVASTCENWII